MRSRAAAEIDEDKAIPRLGRNDLAQYLIDFSMGHIIECNDLPVGRKLLCKKLLIAGHAVLPSNTASA